MLVAQSCMDVQVYLSVGNDWEMTIYSDGETILLRSLGLDLTIERIYELAWV